MSKQADNKKYSLNIENWVEDKKKTKNFHPFNPRQHIVERYEKPSTEEPNFFSFHY